MRVINRKEIKENISYLKKLEKRINHKKLSYRILMPILLKENKNLQLKEVSNLLPVSYSTLKRWWGYYKEGGLRKLLEWNVEGYKGKLTPQQEQIFLEELKKRKI